MCLVKRLTTGTNTILWALDKFDKVIIHGFDFFIKSKTHYFDNNFKKFLVKKHILPKGNKHSMEKEKEYIEKLISSGKVQRLID